MKKILTGVKAILLIFFLSQLFVQSSFAQIKIGVKAGFTFANLNGGFASHNNRFRLGGHLGGYGNYALNDKMGIQVEMLLNQKGTINRNFPNTWVRINYLDLPVLFTYSFTDQFSAHAGLEFSVPISAYVDEENHDKRRYFIHDINHLAVSVPVGITYSMDNGLNAGLRADIGLSAIGNDGARNNAFLLSLGYTFYKGSSTSGKK
jgi:hypothetical protein